MHRRQLLTMIAAVTGTTMIGAGRALAYQPTGTGENLFTAADAALLDEVAETLLPETDTPGGRAAGVGAFMTQYVSDCYRAPERDSFRAGLRALEAEAETGYGRSFMEMSPEERQEMLQQAAVAARAQARLVAEARERREQSLDQQSAADTAADEPQEEVVEPQLHWFTPIQQLTLFGFFTSETGATEVLRYEAIPGEYIGDLDYDGGPAWAT